MSSPRPGEKRRFLLELWLEPRTAVSQLFRLRGAMKELESDGRAQSISGPGDIDTFIQSTFSSPDCEVRWETER
jgi:hypothetical protein